MLNLPKGLFAWVSANMRDLSRIATALETIAKETVEIRKALQEDDPDREGGS